MRKDLFDKTRKYIRIGGMVVAMLCALTACGSNDYDNSKNDVSPEPSPTEESSNADDEAESGDLSSETKTYERSRESGGEKIHEKGYEIKMEQTEEDSE